MVEAGSDGGVDERGAELEVAGALGLEAPSAMSLEVVGATGSGFAFCSPGASCGAGVFAEGCRRSDSVCCGNEVGATGVDSAEGAGNTVGNTDCVSAWGLAATRSPNWMIDAPNCRR